MRGKFGLLLDRVLELPLEEQKNILDIFTKEIEEIELNERNLIETCATNGHMYLGELEGWYDCSYCKSEYGDRKRMIDSLWYVDNNIERNVYIVWHRKCNKCGYIETSRGKIPSLVVEAIKKESANVKCKRI